MNSKHGVILLTLAALIAICTGLAHLSCIYFGPECYAAQLAPPIIVESAKAGTFLAPLGAIFASAIYILLGCYALSGAKIIRKLPLLKFGIYTIAFVCIVRGILPLQLWLRQPDKVSDAVFYTGIVWLIAGLLYFFGFRASHNRNRF